MEEVNITEEELKYYKELETRASRYSRDVDTSDTPLQSSSRTLPRRNNTYIKCREHDPKSKNDHWKPENAACPSCFIFNSSTTFPNGVLPTHMSIIQLLLGYKEIKSKEGEVVRNVSGEWLVSVDIALHWIFCNVYPSTTVTIHKKVSKFWYDFKRLKNYPHAKKGDTYWKDVALFTAQLSTIMDVRGDDSQTKKQQIFWDVKMCDLDRSFYKVQCGNPPTGYCEKFIDNKWKKTRARKLARDNRSGLEYYEFVQDDSTTENIEPVDIENTTEENDPTYTEIEEAPAKKMKCE